MRIQFMGTPKFAADILQALIDDESCDVVGVCSSEDAIRGRGNKKVPSPVKELALNNNIPIELKTDVDFICVAAYGKILKEDVLSLPKYNCLNVHGSLLPKWRGAAPVERAILSGEDKTGVSIMQMEEGLDTGPYCSQVSFNVENMTSAEVYEKMAECGSKALIESMKNIIRGNANWTCQDDTQASYAKKIEKTELYIDDSAISSYRKILASSRAHQSKCEIAGKTVTVLEAKVSSDKILENCVVFKDKKLLLGFNDGALEITKLKPDNKKEMEASAFASGIQNIKSGDVTWKKISKN